MEKNAIAKNGKVGNWEKNSTHIVRVINARGSGLHVAASFSSALHAVIYG